MILALIFLKFYIFSLYSYLLCNKRWNVPFLIRMRYSVISVKTRQFFILFFLGSFISQVYIANAAETAPFGQRVFAMQKKLAEKGNPLAQYKLGTFYECGISVKPNMEEALKWYKKASAKGHKSAANRMVFIEIKTQGYREADHAEWLQRIKNEAASGNMHSIILLGQLYHRGLGVKQDYAKAMKLLSKAITKGHSEIDDEIDDLQKKLNKQRRRGVAYKKPKQTAEKIALESSK